MTPGLTYADNQILAILAVALAEQSPETWRQRYVIDPVADRLLASIWPQGLEE